MKKVLIIILHILGYPLLLAAVLYFNWNIIMTQTKNYGIFVFVGVIVAALMAIIYYICYACITAKKKKKKKTVFNQTVRLCMVVVITMTGLWAVADLALPDFLATATSSTLYYEELADGWNDRADVNEDLLNTFIELNVKAGTLPYDSSKMTEEQAIEYYKKAGFKTNVKELSDNEYYKSISGLLAIQFQSIDANGYQTFTHPWIDFATSNRLTIPCLVHLLLDEREVAVDKLTDMEYTKYEKKEDGTIEVDTVLFAVYDEDEKKITLKGVNWTVLDMLGTDTVLDLYSMTGDTVANVLGNSLTMGIINDSLLPSLIKTVGADELIGSEIQIFLSSDYNDETGKVTELTLTLRPMNGKRGVLGYQEMAWLNSNGLIYAMVGLFSTRKLFLIFAAWGVVINLLIGALRGMGKEEKELRNKLNNSRIRKDTRIEYGEPEVMPGRLVR